MDAFELLKTDHEKVAQLFDQLEAASGKAKLNIFQQIKTELELHMHIEETIFYPALEKPEQTHDLTLEAFEEHAVVKNLLAELNKARTADDEWEAKAKVLRENVEHHVEEEENELFDKASDALSDEEIEVLGDRMSAEKARKQGRSAKSGKQSKSKQASDERGGILSRIASFVGVGGSSDTPRRSGKKTSKKQPASKASSKTSKSKKSSAKTTSKKSVRAASATASKRSATAQSSKRVAAKERSAGTTKRTTAKAGKKAAKKSSRKR